MELGHRFYHNRGDNFLSAGLRIVGNKGVAVSESSDEGENCVCHRYRRQCQCCYSASSCGQETVNNGKSSFDVAGVSTVYCCGDSGKRRRQSAYPVINNDHCCYHQEESKPDKQISDSNNDDEGLSVSQQYQICLRRSTFSVHYQSPPLQHNQKRAKLNLT